MSTATRIVDWDRQNRQWVMLADDGGETMFHRGEKAPDEEMQQLEWNDQNPGVPPGLVPDNIPRQDDPGLPPRIVVSVLLGSTGEWPERLEAPEGGTAPEYAVGFLGKFWYDQR